MSGDSRFSVGLRVGLAGLALLVIGAEGKADAIRPTITYSTAMHFQPLGGIPWNLREVSLLGVDHQTVQAAAPIPQDSFPTGPFDGSAAEFSLGKLLVELPSEGVRRGGDSFDFMIGIHAINGVEYDRTISASARGHMEGVLRADGTSSLKFSIDSLEIPLPVPPSTFPGENLAYKIVIAPEGLSGEVSFSSKLEIPLTTQLVAINTPEPSTWAIFSIAALGAWCSTRRRAGKQARRPA